MIMVVLSKLVIFIILEKTSRSTWGKTFVCKLCCLIRAFAVSTFSDLLPRVAIKTQGYEMKVWLFLSMDSVFIILEITSRSMRGKNFVNYVV